MPATDAEADAHSRAARCASECWAPVLQGRRHLKKSDVQGVVSRFRSLRRRAGRRVVETELSREELAEVLGLDDAGADVGPIFEALISRGGPGGGEGGGGRVLPCDLRLLLVVLAGLTKAKAADRMRFAAMLLDERSRGYLLEDQLALILRANALHSSSARDDFAAQARALISRVEAARGAELPDAEGGSGITHDELVEAVRRFPGDVFPADGHQPIDLDGSQALAAQQLPARDEAPPEPPAEPPEPPAAQAGPPEPPARPQQQLGPPEEPLERMPRPEPPRPSEPRERSQQPERPAEPSQPRGPGAGAAAGGAGGAAAASPREAAAAGSEGAAEGARRGGAPPGLPPAEEAPGGLADAGTAAQDLAEPAAAGGAGDGPGPLAADLCEAEEAPAPTGRRDGGDALRAAAAASEGPEAHGGLGVGREDPGPSLAAGPAPQEGAGGPGAPAAARERPRPATGPLLGQRPSGSDHAPPEQPRAATGGPAGAGAPEAATLRQGTADRARLLAARAARVIESPPGTGAAAAAGPEREDLRQAPLSQRGGAAAPPAGWEAQPPPPPSARGGAAAVQPPPTPPPRPPAGPATPRAPGTPPPGATPRGSQGASRSARSPLRAVAPDFRRLPLTPGRLELGPERLLPPPPPPACAQAAPEPPPLSERSRSPTPRGRARDGAGGAQAAPPLQPLVESDAAAPTRQAVSPPAWISPPRPPMPALPGQMPSQPSSPQPAPPAGPAASRGSGIDPASLRLDLSRVAAGRAPLPEALRRGASPSGSASSSSSRSGSLSSCRTPPLQPSPEPRGPKGPPPDELDDALARLELGPEPPAEEPLALPLGDRDGRGPQDDRLADQLIDEPETTQWTFGRYLKHKQRRRLLEICGGGSSGTKDSSRGCVSVLGCVLVNLGFLLFFGYRAHGPGSARARAGEGEIVVSEDVIPAFGVILMLGGCAALCHCACFSGVDRGVQEQEDDTFPSDLVDEEAGQQALETRSAGSAGSGHGATYHQAIAQPKRDYRQLTLLLKEELRRAPAQQPQLPLKAAEPPSPRGGGSADSPRAPLARGKVVGAHSTVLDKWPGLDRRGGSLKKPGRRVRIVAEPLEDGALPEGPGRRVAARGRALRSA